MKKWLDEEYGFEVEITGYLRGNNAEGLCRNGEEIRAIEKNPGSYMKVVVNM